MTDIEDILKKRQEAFDRKPNYYTALKLQQAKREREAQIAETRKEWFVLEGDAGQHSIPDLEVMVSAMQEIIRSFNEHKIEDSVGNTLLYIKKVAEHSLIAIGRN